MYYMTRQHPVVIRLTEAERAQLDAEVAAADTTRSALIRRGIKLALYEAERERSINAA